MNSFRRTVIGLGLAVPSLLAPLALRAQDVTTETLLHPPTDSWPIYHGDYTGKRHSKLTQITPLNVKNLTLAWAFQTNQTAQLKSAPLLVNGILYFTVPDNIWAVDARSGRQIWHKTYPAPKALHIGHRGVAVYKDKLYYLTTDAHLQCLDAKNGETKWDVQIADSSKGQWATMSPLIVGNHVMVGASGDFDNLQGFIRSIDAETGATQWQWDATPPVGTRGKTSGGNAWLTGTYDPELKLVYWGTGNPTPVLNGKVRPGDNLYTCSIVALDPETGKLAWAFQPSPHDTHDWDAVEVPVLVDGTFKGKPTKMLMQASRNGYFFVLDRTNGKNLLTVPFGPVNWAKGLDDKGQPIPAPEKEPAPDGRLIAPDEGGMTNYRSPSFDPKTGLFIVSASPSYSLYFAKPADGTYGWAGADYGLWARAVLEAIDYQTGKVRWSHPLGEGHGSYSVLTTDSGLVFTGDTSGNFLALNTSDGKTLWHAYSGSNLNGGPETYLLDGRQYVLMTSGSVLFAWALPEVSTPRTATAHSAAK